MMIRYVNAAGESIELNNASIKLREADFFDYKWETEEVSGKYKFVKEAKKYEALLEIIGSSAIKKKKLNDFFQIAEKDIITNTPGRLYLGDQYLKCYITESKAGPAESPIGVNKELTIFSERPLWIREISYSFKAGEAYSGNSKKYSYKYPYRYANGLTGSYVINDHFTEAYFRMIIYGPVVNPLVIIGQNIYLVNIILENGEYLEIDSINATVYKTMNSGQIVNIFHYRDKKNNVFQPILPGRHSVEWSGKFNFDLTLYTERSEPLWQ